MPGKESPLYREKPRPDAAYPGRRPSQAILQIAMQRKSNLPSSRRSGSCTDSKSDCKRDFNGERPVREPAQVGQWLQAENVSGMFLPRGLSAGGSCGSHCDIVSRPFVWSSGALVVSRHVLNWRISHLVSQEKSPGGSADRTDGSSCFAMSIRKTAVSAPVQTRNLFCGVQPVAPVIALSRLDGRRM